MNIKTVLFKFGDKIIFAIFAVLFLFSTFKLVSNPGGSGDLVIEAVPVAGDADVAIPRNFRVTRNQISSPPVSSTGGGFATDPDMIEPIEGKEKSCPQCFRIVPIDIDECPECGYPFIPSDDEDRDGMPNEWEDRYDVTDRKVADANEDPDGDGYANIEEYHGGSDPGDSASIPKALVIVEIGREQVDILFQGYLVNEGGDAEKPDPAYWVLQINWGKYADTSIVPYGGYFRGYRMYPLRKKVEKVWNESLGIEEIIETWFLTIQKRGRKPIVVGMNMIAHEQESYAKLRITTGIDRGDTTEKLYDTEKFTANGMEYTVLEVNAEKRQVTLMDENENVIRLKKEE